MRSLNLREDARYHRIQKLHSAEEDGLALGSRVSGVVRVRSEVHEVPLVILHTRIQG